MLEHWLHPIHHELLSLAKRLPTYSLGGKLQFHTPDEGIAAIPKNALVIIGWDESADEVRRQLYPLAWHFSGLVAMDLGNLIKNNDDFGAALLCELIDGGIVPIILCGSEAKPIPQFLAHKDLRKYTNIAIVSEKIPQASSPNLKTFITPLIQSYQSSVFHLDFLAYQSHFCDPALWQWLQDSKYDGLRLGQLRADLEEAEPAMRDADMLLFCLDALKWAECPGVAAQSPNGLTAEEACQLSRYAGMSDKLGSFSIAGYLPDLDLSGQTSQIIAQMIWYFMDGYQHRQDDFPVSLSGMKEYVVDYKHLEYQLTFWKSSKTSRWWMQIPLGKQEGLGRHRLLPCSYKDYLQASTGELPGRLMRALERLG